MSLQTDFVSQDFLDTPIGLRFNLAQTIFETARQDPHRTALLFRKNDQEMILSYQGLARHIEAVAMQLRDIGLKLGDRLGLLLYNTPGFVFTYFAALSLGLVVVPINTRLTAPELEHILLDSQTRFLVTTPHFLPTVQLFSPELALQNILLEKDSSVLEEVDNPVSKMELPFSFLSDPSLDSNASISQFGSAQFQPIPLLKDTLAVLIYTSGTTGKPKGVMLSHGNILADATANVSVIEASATDRFITISPLFHVFGQTNILISALLAGASLVLQHKFTPRRTLEAIEQYRVTFMAAVPTMYLMMLSHLRERQYDLSALRVCHSGASPMAVDTFHAVESAFSAPVQEGYGLSEASSIVCSNPLYGTRKPGSVGLPLEGVRVRVMAEPDREAEAGEIGELQVAGDIVMLGYYGQPGLTEQAFATGPDGTRWLKTKDLGHKDGDGYLSIVDRQDDLINIGGVKVYPREIEEVLHRHPFVQAVAITGIPLDRRREMIKAFVVLYAGETITKEALQEFCRPYLSDFKIPRHIEFITEIPQGATGKILRRTLREQERQKFLGDRL